MIFRSCFNSSMPVFPGTNAVESDLAVRLDARTSSSNVFNSVRAYALRNHSKESQLAAVRFIGRFSM